ncbi:PBSX family phage terminase large subunit [Lactococcus allomyrinae]|uniref:PBSX family phage terminase large subunit n=1 Tax=Lactococcus allomyrinae TaxID=2419773 RepID=A0A387BL14_9LACT|nr:PBSX family phage terminase large subunit [Lactococcus allomyrinae]AYG01696.1 PBSX family phage terminase large subunit [Lactococcus allomyrinae]
MEIRLKFASEKHQALMLDDNDTIFASGSRRSGKSIIVGQKIITTIIENKNVNCVVIRADKDQNKDTTYATLTRIIKQMGLLSKFIIRKSPLEIEYKPTGQMIVFRGTDDPEKVKGIDFATGGLHMIWFDEITSISKEAYETITGSFSGTGEYKVINQTLITTNPAGSANWVKDYFIDRNVYKASIYSFTIFDNKFLSQKDREHFLRLKDIDYPRYRREALGEWVYSEGLIYKWQEVDRIPQALPFVFAIDWGNSQGSGDPTAAVKVSFSGDNIFVEQIAYSNKLTLNLLAQYLPRNINIFCDLNAPHAVDFLMNAGFDMQPMKKAVAKGRVVDGVQIVQGKNLNVLRNSRDLIAELNNYLYDKDGNITTQNKTPDHLLDAMRYAVIGHERIGSV